MTQQDPVYVRTTVFIDGVCPCDGCGADYKYDALVNLQEHWDAFIIPWFTYDVASSIINEHGENTDYDWDDCDIRIIDGIIYYSVGGGEWMWECREQFSDDECRCNDCEHRVQTG